MTKKNLYYAAVFARPRYIKLAILNFFLAICSWPRVTIEVFTRKSFGERYFNFSVCLFVGLLLFLFPFGFERYDYRLGHVIFSNFSWYAYLAAYLYASFRRYLEVKREPSVFDFSKFSLSSGVVRWQFFTFKWRGKAPSTRFVTTYVEPGIFVAAGILLILSGQKLGYLFIACGIIYSISWAAQFHIGDTFVMDKIDELILNEELVESFVNEKPAGEARGFEHYGRRPSNINFRRKVAESMIDEEPPVDVY